MKYRYVLSLIIVSVIWGATFPLVKLSLSYITPLGFLALRFLIAFLLIFLIYFKRIMKNMVALKSSLILGILLFLGYAFQTVGLKYTTSSNAGFITGLYVVFTPLFSYFIVNEKLGARRITAVLLSIVGLYLLSGIRGLNFGDILELLCAIAYGAHVATIGKFTREYDSATLTMFQLFFVFLFSSVWWSGEGFPIQSSPILIFGILFTGIFASAIGILVQVNAQRFVSPSRAAVIFTTEPVFAGIFSFIFLGETFGFVSMTGASLILIAMLLASIEKRN